MRVKEAPASALRAVFGGIGSLLGVSDKVRAKPAAPEATVSTEAAPPETTTPETVAPVATTAETAPATEVAAPAAEAPEAATVVEVDVVEVAVVEVAVIEVAVIEEAAPEAVAAEPVAAEPVAVEPVVAETAVAGDAAALPLANYDDLSIASLRARLRNLSADQLGTLIEYEKSHTARPDVISMFERRIVKLADGTGGTEA
jgi:hypothetical protein